MTFKQVVDGLVKAIKAYMFVIYAAAAIGIGVAIVEQVLRGG